MLSKYIFPILPLCPILLACSGSGNPESTGTGFSPFFPVTPGVILTYDVIYVPLGSSDSIRSELVIRPLAFRYLNDSTIVSEYAVTCSVTAARDLFTHGDSLMSLCQSPDRVLFYYSIHDTYPIRLLSLPLFLGKEWEEFGFPAVSSVLWIGSMSVPAGTFGSCYQIRRYLNLDPRFRSRFHVDEYTWYKESLGFIQLNELDSYGHFLLKLTLRSYSYISIP